MASREMSHLRSVPVFAFLIVALGCGPTALRPETGGGSTVSLGGQSSRRVETLTDLEEVRAVVTADGLVYAATDSGLLRFDASGAGAFVEGLPSDDVTGLAQDEGGLLVATGAGMVRLAGEEVTPVEGVPRIGHLTDMVKAADGTVWLCGLGGLARRTEARWETFGEPVRCTDLAPTPEGTLWAGTTEGLWYVEGDVIREHPISGGMPEGYVREIVPVLPGQILAILQGPNDAQIGYWDGERWYGYTLRGLEGQAVGLVRRGRDVLLVSQNRVLAIAPRGEGVPLEPLHAEEGTVRSFRARTQAADEHPPGELPGPDALAEPKPLADVPDNRPSVDAPGFRARPLEVELPGLAYDAFVQGADAFLAIANGGVLQLPAEGMPRHLRSLTLVPERDLQVATDPSRTVWMLSRDRQLAKFVNDRLRRSPLPEGHVAQALATGPEGAVLVTRVPEEGPNVVQLFVHRGSSWSPLVRRTLELPTELVGVPFAGVDADGKVWLALRVRRESGSGERMRGAAVIDPNVEQVVYHHRGADRAAGGLPLPDEISAMDFDTDNAWFASLSGLVRVGASQAVVFGEARGVRGEVVTDAVVGSGVIWVASAEGLGTYDRSAFDYNQPARVQEARPTRLAMDLSGHLWATSNDGLVLHEGEEWTLLDADDGLPDAALNDVEVDAAGRVWILAEDRVMVLER
jgi:sugar lactone lactonase YvrE